MAMIPQNDPGLPKSVQLWGCNFRCLLAIAEIYTGEDLTLDDITAAYYDLKGRAMDDECTMNEHLGQAIRWAFHRLGHPTYSCHQIGIAYPPAKFEFWKSARIYTILKGILHPEGYEGRTEVTYHFRLGDRKGELIFDPYEPSLPVMREHSVLFYEVTG